MESRDYTGEFESFLQEKADQYKLYPSDRVWNAINDKLHPKSRWSYWVVAAMFLGLGIGGKVYDSGFQRGFEQGADIENSTTQELASLAPVIPITKASPSRQNAADRASLVGSFIADQGSAPANHAGEISFEANEFGQVSLPETVLVSSPEPELTASPESLRVIVANEELQQTEGTEASDPSSAEASAAAYQQSLLPEAGETTEESFVDASVDGRRINAYASVPSSQTLGAKDVTAAHLAAPEKAQSIRVLKPRHVNVGWQLYLSPTVSYRKLSGEGMKYYNGFSVANSPDVNKAVTHKPSIGFEIGSALTFATGRNFRFKTGLQLNVNQYDVQAFRFTPEVAPLTRGGIGHTEITAISRYRNYNGFSKTWLTNKHIMMSLPLGAELTLIGNDKVRFNIAGTLQPTYVINNQAYMISTNMKNYAQEPSLYRNFNVAAGAEAYLSIKAGSYKWMIGPQFRYQILSSYKKEYPITEHLVDYGFKIGITR